MKIDFEFITQYGTFKDCLNLEDDVSYSDEEIDAMKQQRLNNWLQIVDAASQLSLEEIETRNLAIQQHLEAMMSDSPPGDEI